MKLSACLIVKDEAENLPRCLASLRGQVDEIVVVDTGSTDDTVAIAEAAGARLGHFAWCDDFAAARNAALDLATGDWILVIDADEELQVSDRAALSALMAGEPAAYLVPLADVVHGRAAGHLGGVVRLFPRHPELRYAGRLHESIGAGMTRLGVPLLETQALGLTHHGYRPEVMAARGKADRNLRLARLGAEEHPERPLAWFDLGRSAIKANRLPEALASWERLRALPPGDPFHAQYLATLEQMCRSLAEAYVQHCQRLAGARLSACLIVKDEAENLPRCLASLKGQVDEIVVVDTGSTDDTVAIAEAAGARLGHFTWCDDFSAARNAALDLATGDWIVVIDADEELALEDAQALRAAMASPEQAYHLEIQNLDALGNVESRYTSAPRMFRRDPGVRFTGRLHESVGSALMAKGWAARLLPGVAIRHHGYVEAAVVGRGKVERNRRLAEAMTREHPEQPESWFHLAAICWHARDAAGTLDAADQALARVASGAFLAAHRQVALATIRAGAFSALGRHAEAMDALDRGLALHPGHPELCYERGLRRADRGDVAGAVADFEACVAAHGRRSENVLRAGITTFLPLAELAGFAAQAGRFEDAAAYIRAAIADPDCPAEERHRLQAVAAKFAELIGTQPKAPTGRAAIIQHLEANPRDPRGFLELALDCFQAGEHDRALVAVSHSLELEASSTAYYMLGLVLLEMGQAGWADRCFATVMQLDPDHPNAMGGRMQARSMPQPPALPEELETTFARLLALAEPPIHLGQAPVAAEPPAPSRPGLRIAGRARPEPIKPSPVVPPGARQADQAATRLDVAFKRYQANDPEGALAEVAESLALFVSPTAYQLLGLALMALGHAPWAERCFAQVLRLNPDHPTALEARLDARAAGEGVKAPEEREALIRRLLALAEPRLTACLIVKDEAENLPRCLASLRGQVDEIVVVDTGSTDDTVAIAEAAGARLGHFAWCDDFAAARNAALDLATGDWILMIDADEELVVDDHLMLQDALRWRLNSGYHTKLTNLGAEGGVESHAVVLRLFQRLPELRYRGRLHENVSEGLRALGWPVPQLQAFRLLHRGYQAGAVDGQGKGGRNVRLAALDAAEHPDSATAQVNLARSLALDGKDAQALALLDEVSSRPGWLATLAEPDMLLGAMTHQDLLRRVERFQDADAVLTTALGRLQGQPDLLFERGNVRFRLGRKADARADFRACLQADPGVITLRPDVTSELPRLALAQMDRARVSACLIVKDEAENLPRCLASLQGLVDEIVVVDTGSTDDTVAIAEAAGARLGRFGWTGNFAEARNASLDLATGDWVLIIDADEELVVDDPRAYRAALQRDGLGAFIFPIHNLKDDGSYQVQPMMRLFRRHDAVRFAGRLHEEVTRAIEAQGWGVEPLPGVHLRHHGYLSDAIAARNKWGRNLEIAIAEVEVNPDSPLAWYNLGRSSLFTGQDGPASGAFEQVARLLAAGVAMGEAPYCNYVLLRHRLMVQAGRPDQAEALLDEGLSRVPGFPEFHFARGVLRRARGDEAGAREDFGACLAPSERYYTGSIRPDLKGLALAQLR